MFDIKKIVRPEILALEKYKSARDDFSGVADIWLNANENPFGFGLNRYPDTSMEKLKKLFANFRKVDPKHLIFGNGSDELIDIIIKTFCEPKKDKILTFTPAFEMYQICATILGVETIQQSLNNHFDIDLCEVIKKLQDVNLKVIFICSPNNPTGNCISTSTVLEICKKFHGIVVIDEAYSDFSDHTFVKDKIPNLVVLQTFSKALGMAGIRLGVAIGSTEVVNLLYKVKPPYNVNSLTQEKAIKVLENSQEIENQISILLKEKQRLSASLKNLSIVKKIYPSSTNFLLVEFDDSAKIYHMLLSQNIVVRDRSKLLPNTLRITMGTPKENDQLLMALTGQKTKKSTRKGICIRKTAETEIKVVVDLENKYRSMISTGIYFFDHMLEQIVRHGEIGLEILTKGDLHIDSHHTIEDTALALGEAFNKALGDKIGIARYGFLLPMDDCLAQIAIDFGGRSWLTWDVTFDTPMIGGFPSDMASHFFKSFSDTAKCNINIKAEGKNNHHKIEAIFKAFAKAIKMAIKKDKNGQLPSTKGIL